MSRRSFLRVSGSTALSLAGLNITEPVHAQVRSTRIPTIILFLSGGPPPKEMLHPDEAASPENLRGPFTSIQTRTSGIRFSENWPRLANIQDRFALLRAIDSGTTDHVTGMRHAMLYRNKTIAEIAGEGATTNGVSYVLLNPGRAYEGLSQGFRPNESLAPRWNADTRRFTQGQQAIPMEFGPLGGPILRELPPRPSAERLQQRRHLLEAFDTADIRSPQVERMRRIYRTALDIYTDDSDIFQAVELPDTEREEYGNSTTGNMMLTAERFVRRCAASVVIYHELSGGAWDMHDNLRERMRNDAPEVDRAVATMIEKIVGGQLNATFVMMSEIGRHPEVADGRGVNGMGPPTGRQHWRYGQQAVFAGPRIRRGVVHGRMNNRGAIMEGAVQQRGELGNTILAASGGELNPTDPRVREILQ